jgi:hypothetical protein
MALNVGLGVSLGNMQLCKRIRGKVGEVMSTKACITNDEPSRWILNGRYTHNEMEEPLLDHQITVVHFLFLNVQQDATI